MGSTYKTMLVQSSDKLGKVDNDAKDNAIKYFDEAIKLFRGGTSSATTDNAIADASVALAEVYLLVYDKELPGTSSESSDDASATPVLSLGTKSLLDIATDHLERSLNFRKKRRGDLDAEVASTLHLLGIVHLKKGPEHIDDALDALKAAFDTRKDLLSPNHIDLGETIGLLGKAHLSRKEGDDLSHALGAFTEALRIQEHGRDALSEDDDSFDLCWKVATSESSIGECHFLQRDMPSAREAFQRSFADLVVIEQMLSVDQKNGNGPMSMQINLQLKLADVLCNIARVNVKNEELDEALTAYNSSLQHLQKGLALARDCEDGDDNDDDEETPSTSKAVHAIIIEEAAIKMEVAAVYEKKGRPEQSIELYQWCSKVFRNNEKEASPSLVLSLRRLGQALLRQEKFDEAVTALEEALESQKSIIEKKAKTNAPLSGDQRVMNLNVGLLHFELAQGLSKIDDKKGALTHYRNVVSLLDELALQPWDLVSTDDREPVTETQKSLNRKLLQCYDQMKHLTPGTMTEEEEEDELNDIFHRIANLRAAFGEHEAARDLYLAVVSHQREMQGDNSLAVADLLFNLGTVYSCLQDMENAFDCHEECQLISEAIIGKDSPQLAENMLALGDISMSQEEFDDALHWFSSAERIMRQKEDGLSKADESAVATLVFKKGKCLQALGHGDNATQCFKTALDLFKRTEDLERVEVSDMMNALGNTAKVEGDLDKAMILYRQSLHLRKTLGDELSVANTKNNIGAVFHARGDMAQAMKFFSESLESKTLLLGVDHPETARSLANVGQIFLDNNDYLKARRCFMEALRVLRSVLGVDSVEVAICLYNLGVALEEGDDFSNALKVYQEAIEIFSRNADDHITFGFALHNAGVIYSKRNKPKDAVQFLEGALDVKIASFGPDSDDTADTRYCLAGALHELGDLDEALEHYSDVLRVRVRHLGKDSIETANVLMGLGEIHKSQGELEEAISCLVEALRVKRINGADDEEISSLSITVGALFRGVKDLESALQYFTDALEAKTYENSGKIHLDSSLCLSLMAGCLFDQGLFQEALQRYQEALEIRLLSDDDDDEGKVGALLEKIGTAQVKLGEHEGAIVALKESLTIKERGGIADDPMVEFEIGSVYHLMGKSNFALGTTKRPFVATTPLSNFSRLVAMNTLLRRRPVLHCSTRPMSTTRRTSFPHQCSYTRKFSRRNTSHPIPGSSAKLFSDWDNRMLQKGSMRRPSVSPKRPSKSSNNKLLKFLTRTFLSTSRRTLLQLSRASLSFP
jgi:tetratricopeptide (TPR) repeat protein